MNKLLKVAKREYVETVKTKVFLLSIFLMPLFVAGIIFISIKIQKKTISGPRPPRHVAVINLSEKLSEGLDSIFAQYNESHPQRKIMLKHYTDEYHVLNTRAEELKEDVREGKIEAFLFIDKDVLENKGKVYFFTKNITDFELYTTVQRLVNDAVFDTRYRMHDLSPQLITKLRRRVPVEQMDLSAKTEKKRNVFAMMIIPFYFMFLMFFGIFAVSQGLLMSVIEEKTSRVIEVLLAAVSPFQLMAGKIVGQSAVGITLVNLYGIAAYVTATFLGMGDFMNGSIVVYFIIYYVLGFLLISSMLAAVGSACNTIKESQSLMGPVMILFILPMILWTHIVQQPEGTLSTVLSFIPPMTPMVMILRIVARPDLPLLQILASILLLTVSVPVAMWVCGKIFRTGILMYGKPPTPRELLRWILYN